MIMYTYENMLAVTNRKLCRGPFLEQIEFLAGKHPAGIILREKDLTEPEYEELAGKVLDICSRHDTRCILHTWPEAARNLNCGCIHLPMKILENGKGTLDGFEQIGASVHSVEEAVCAYELGASYLTAGHIFRTDCKKGIPGRGLAFLNQVCTSVPIPVYGIGGITPGNADQVLAWGAAGYCVMSGVM